MRMLSLPTLALFAIASTSLAANIPVCNTGFLSGCTADTNANTGALSTDGTWYLASGPTGTRSADLFITVNGTFPLDGAHYVLNNALASWVSPSSDMAVYSAANQSYYYAVQFSLAGFDPATAALTGSWLSDNDGLGVFLNGVNIAQSSLPSFGGFGGPLVNLNVPAGSGFNGAVNTLVFQVNNGPLDGPGGTMPSPAGVRIQLTLSADPLLDPPVDTPEPASIGLMAAGLVALFTFRRRG
ncbi:MAG: PEP-CTERM sorting domain-containing protein [Bryobacteraceae bacterium]|nr:PEP-CTERM sorting domain-containing protein [Bryobacteraceae bacterium]